MNSRTQWLWAAIALAAFQLHAADAPALGFRSAEISNHRVLRYKCAGTGTPTVLIEAALGVSVEGTFAREQPVGWAVIAPKVAAVTRTCVYDRAGLGLSTGLTAPGTSREAAQDLHELLQVLQIPPPYILAAHSLGGMDALMFADSFPASIAGMVLVDSAHPQQQKMFAQVLPPRATDESDLQKGYRDGPSGPVNGEWFDFRRNTEQMSHLPDLGAKPLIVLTRDPKASQNSGLVPPEWEAAVEPVWQQLQNQLASLSTRSQHIIVPHAGHAIQFEQPDVVTHAILDVIAQVKGRMKVRS